ncbi:TRAP transporter substrate-binding protein [Vreelandella populi]|uniref:C4-dicarboxylate ABC transporter substrate-binding protein n=1 Tax=Vreelandella populi TaxID=2498858 RepID=A0A433LD49_9GAMM|nr:TRAP transporter substrate-binding protein [Halomonas populi]RUR46529.1 C4-dicarboxylate ABC transporter substrate-binding protein [Halomonas populi]RUR52970.1 C4-dicarboxylate ABC transporter substrate-binding protein [Halomonas populi]
MTTLKLQNHRLNAGKSLLAALGLAIVSGQANAQSFSLDFSNEYNASSIHAQGDAYFIDKVKELTDGDISITLHTGGALGFNSGDHFYAVADGAVDIADTLSGTMSGVDSLFLLSSLPFLVNDIEDARQLYGIAKPYYEAVFEDNDQILLYASPWPPSGIWSKDAIDSADDLKSLKIRTFDRSGTETFRNVGASPVSLSWGDVVPQLATGGISAVLTSAEAGANGSFWEHQNHFSAVQYAIPLNMVHMNKAVFDSFSEEQQQAVLEAARLTDQHNWAAVETRTEENYQMLAENDVEVSDPVAQGLTDALSEASASVIENWLGSTGDTGETIMDEFRGQQ